MILDLVDSRGIVFGKYDPSIKGSERDKGSYEHARMLVDERRDEGLISQSLHDRIIDDMNSHRTRFIISSRGSEPAAPLVDSLVA